MPTVDETFLLALQQYQAGDAHEAARLCQLILAIDNGNVEALHLLGLMDLHAGRVDQAIDLIGRAVASNPWMAVYHLNLGAAYQAAGHHEEAVASYQMALQRDPSAAPAHSNLGDALRVLGRPQEAEHHCRLALQIHPDCAEASGNLGNALLDQNRIDEAIEAFQAALNANSHMAKAQNGLGIALERQERFDEALRCFQVATEQAPAYVDAHCNMGLTLHRMHRHAPAAECYRRALQLKPDHVDAHFGLGNALRDLGQLEEALVYLGEAVRLSPEHADAHWNRALIWLLLGDFERGWPEYEWRLQLPGRVRRAFSQPLWDGSNLQGKTVLLHAEQGLGDTLQFVRYAALVKQRVGKVVVECQRPLLRVLRGVAGIDSLVPAGSALPPFDSQIPLLSLPRIFRTSLGDIPGTSPYLIVDSQLVEYWRKVLRGVEGFKVGIVWQCDPANPPWGRAIPLTQFGRLAEVEGVQLISMQKGAGAEQLAASAERFRILELGNRLDEASGPFMDTAAIMKNLDLVISCDTAPAHLAGALGAPVWLAVPAAPDWRWSLHRDDSPWYPSMRLFRQARAGHWDDVMQRMAVALGDLLSRRVK